MSVSARDQILEYLDAPRRAARILDPSTLRHLASAIEARSPEMVARRALTPEGVERLAEILLAGGKPTVGFWRRYRVPS
jgi:hypothetical protein